MIILWKGILAAGLAVLLCASASAADSKKKKSESSAVESEAGSTVTLSTNETKAKIDLAVYKLSPSDLVHIKVYKEDDLETKGRIAKDGTITFPLLKVVNIGGMTVEEAANHISERLGKDYLVNPQVTVAVLEYAKKWFHVVGEVNRQGSYPIPEEESMDLMRAIAVAGGFTQIANKSKVMVSRMVSGKKVIEIIDAKAREKDKSAKPYLILPDDTITVPQSVF